MLLDVIDAWVEIVEPDAARARMEEIKGNIGDQNYALGSDLDLSKYRAVSIWCKRFSVNFGAAALRPTRTSENNLSGRVSKTAT